MSLTVMSCMTQPRSFPIPMRGNEAIEVGYQRRVGFEFPIPMRGNEPPMAG